MIKKDKIKGRILSVTNTFYTPILARECSESYFLAIRKFF